VPEPKAEPKTETPVGPGERSAGLGQQLSAFLEWVKPYKEFAALAFAVIAAISGGVAWAVAHFATRAELFYLECRINNNMATQAFSDKSDALAASIQLRNSQIKQLTDQAPSNSSNITIARLSDEVSALTKEQSTYSVDAKKKIDENAKRCIQDAPTQVAPEK
jgi:hypothetical protein